MPQQRYRTRGINGEYRQLRREEKCAYRQKHKRNAKYMRKIRRKWKNEAF
jgi:hypothetical protein